MGTRVAQAPFVVVPSFLPPTPWQELFDVGPRLQWQRPPPGEPRHARCTLAEAQGEPGMGARAAPHPQQPQALCSSRQPRGGFMLLGNWDGGMFPGQPCRQRAIVHCSPRAPQSTPAPLAEPAPSSPAQVPGGGTGWWQRVPTCRTPVQLPEFNGMLHLGVPEPKQPSLHAPPSHPPTPAPRTHPHHTGDRGGPHWAQAGELDPAAAEQGTGRDRDGCPCTPAGRGKRAAPGCPGAAGASWREPEPLSPAPPARPAPRGLAGAGRGGRCLSLAGGYVLQTQGCAPCPAQLSLAAD